MIVRERERETGFKKKQDRNSPEKEKNKKGKYR